MQARSYIECCGGQAECAKTLSAEMARARVGGYYRSTSVESESAAFSGSARSSVSEFDSECELAVEGTSASASSLLSARAPASPVSPLSPRALPHATAQQLLTGVDLKAVALKEAGTEAEAERVAAGTGSGRDEARALGKKRSSPVLPTFLKRASFSTPVLDRLSIDRAAQAGSRAIALR